MKMASLSCHPLVHTESNQGYFVLMKARNEDQPGQMQSGLVQVFHVQL